MPTTSFLLPEGCDGRTDQLYSSDIALRLLPPQGADYCGRLDLAEKGERW